MGVPVLIIGKSGTGKSASLRNFKKNELGIINVLGKPLPFKNDFQYIVTDNYPKVKNALLQAKVDILVVDDSGYLITGEFMRRAKEKGYEKFTELANNFYELISYIQHELPEQRIVYLVMHEDENDSGIVKPKTIGKLLDEKVCVEGMFTIVLRSMKNENRYVFRTQSNGFDIAKTPMGLFDSDEIDNDLKYVTEQIKEYYNIGNKEAKDEKN